MKSYRGAVLTECVALFVAGTLLCSLSEALGKFTMFGGLSLLIVYGIERQAISMEARRMRDAEIEMRMRAEIYQGNRNDF